MTLQPGSRFGVFDVHSLLGRGGMGEVFRARDSRLGREVALKVLPPAFAADPERRERLEREARALAALTHPGIAAIYDTVDVDGTRALVLELVEGETLEQRLRGGPLPIREAAGIARVIAEALDAAHDRGLVHRDLKPANVKITPGGDVKLLDFGIARMLVDRDGSDTETVVGTERGAIVGTAAYMSPEQARGHAVDKRADVWAFGCVLFEMLTGHAAFRGETSSDSIARTLSSEPDWTLLPATTPAGVIRVLRRCLEKDPKQRLRGLGGLELSFEDLTAPAGSSSSSRLPWAVAVIALLATVAIWLTRPTPEPISEAAALRFEIPPSVQVAESGSMGLSPDGRRIAFIGTGADGRFRMWERSLDSLETRPISGTEGEVAANSTMFWSPDSRSIGFYADGAVRRISREGGTATIVCRLPGVSVGGAWSEAGDIVVGNTTSGLVRCPADGGEPTAVTNGAPAGSGTAGALHLLPVFLRDGKRLLYFRVSRNDPSANGLYVADLGLPPDRQSGTRLLETGFAARYVADGSGREHILFVRNRDLWMVPFDGNRLALTGEPIQIADSIYTFRDHGSFDANGHVLVYLGGAPDYQMVWRNRRGQDLTKLGEPGAYIGIALSADGTHVALTRENKLNRSDQDLWLVDVARNTTSRFTSNPLPESVPGWTADSQAVLYALGHDSAEVRSKSVNGAEQTVLKHAELGQVAVNPLLSTFSASGDGGWLALSVDTRGPSRSDIWIVGLREPRRHAALVQQDFEQRQPVFSPDGQWLAYVSNETGTDAVFVRRLTWPAEGLPTTSSPMPVSRGGGRSPRWRGDSGELFFQSLAGQIMAARVDKAGFSEPAPLFGAPGALAEWGVAADGQRFLLALPVENRDLPFTVMVNWQDGRK